VAEGTYYPDQGEDQTEDNRDASFHLVGGVKVYGGFEGSEESVEGRDPEANTTVLSGDIGTEDFAADNSYHVVNGLPDNDGRVILQGFTITGGNADGGNRQGDKSRGAGMYLLDGRISNVVFKNNNSYGSGGAIYFGGDSNIIDCTFKKNSSSFHFSVGGGAVYIFGGSPTISNSTLENNESQNGAGIYFDGGSPAIENVLFVDNKGSAIHSDGTSPTIMKSTFIGNKGIKWGAGLHLSSSTSIVINSSFSGNSVDNVNRYGGAGIYAKGGELKVLNSSFSSNESAGGFGGAIYSVDATTRIFNSVMWGNNARIGSEMSTDENVYIENPIVQGGVPNSVTDGGENLDADPLFVEDDGTDGTPGTRDDNLMLRGKSPAIDAGDNKALDLNDDGSYNVLEDLAGGDRIVGDTVDIGAYEYENGG